jgi:DNA-binding transcriptional LysR family regulator
VKFKLRQMEVFRAVMVTGSINGAAKLLFTSQPAISRIVAHTEQTLGLSLFDRIKGKLVPTPEAEALFVEVDQFYQQALQVEEFASGLASGGSGTLNVAASPCLCRGIVTEAIARFAQRYPQIRVNVRATLLNDMAQQVLSNKVDVAVCVLPLDNPNLKIEPFTHGRMFCIVPEGHELAGRDEISIADLPGYPLITHHPGIPFGQLVSAACRKANVSLTSRVDIYQTDVACSLVRAGVGIALVDEFTLHGNRAGLHVLALKEEIPLTPSIVRSALASPQNHAEKFVDVLRRMHAPAPGKQKG